MKAIGPSVYACQDWSEGFRCCYSPLCARPVTWVIVEHGTHRLYDEGHNIYVIHTMCAEHAQRALSRPSASPVVLHGRVCEVAHIPSTQGSRSMEDHRARVRRVIEAVQAKVALTTMQE